MSAACEFYLDACGNPDDIEELVARLTDVNHTPHFFIWFDCGSVEDEDSDYREWGDRWVRFKGQCKNSIKMMTQPMPRYSDYDASVHTTIQKTSEELGLEIEVYAETYPYCAEHYLCCSGEVKSNEVRDRWEDFGDEEGPLWEV